MLQLGTSRLSGWVDVPSSKSISHRYLICAALSKGESVVHALAQNDDIVATANALRAMGADIRMDGDTAYVRGIGRIEPLSDLVLDCNESGSTVRFLLPLVLAFGARNVRLIGRGKLGTRPMQVYRDLCATQGIEYKDASDASGKLDIMLNGKLHADTFRIPADISSQFLSGLLMAMPLLDAPSRLECVGERTSVGYIDLTLQSMQDFGVQVECDENGYRVAPQSYRSTVCMVEGDYSQAAFFAVANAIGNTVHMRGLRQDSMQGDRVIFELLEMLQAARSGETVRVDGENCPDIIPVFCVACALSKATCIIDRVARLRIKECDRLDATVRELSAIGADIQAQADSIVVHGKPNLVGGVAVSSHADHRIAMMLAIAATRCDKPITLDQAECVSKSYPDFFTVYRELGGTAV